MLAHLQGTPLNSARLAQSLGVSAPMINRYLDLLSDLMLLRRVPARSGHLGKRLVKSPKIYLRDSGILHALLEIESSNQLLGHPIVGASWEGFVTEQVIGALGQHRNPMYYRTQDGAEIDLIFERQGMPFLAIEIKRSSAPKISASFTQTCDTLGIKHRLLVYSGDETYAARDGVSVSTLADAIRTAKQVFDT